jgi:hypothetical protein
LADYVVAQAAVLIVPTTKNFKKKLEAELRRIQTQTGPIKIEANLDSAKAVAQFGATKAWMEKQDITLQAKVDTRTLTEIRHRYEDLQREMKKGLVLNLKVVGMSLLPQLVQGLAAVNASMVQLSQSALILPGVLSGVLSSFGALATGVSGVKDAFKEYGDAQKNAAQEGLKARNSAKNVQNAYRDLGRSFKDAKRNLEDLNAELRGAPLDEADAIIALAEARAEAADRYQKSGLQQQKDALAVAKAENELVNVRLRNSRLIQDAAEANAKGVAGADAVVEATERLSKAQDELATQATKATDSLKELSPNAQAFVKALTGMQSQWSAFRNSTQDRLFAGLDAEVTRLAQVSLPTLEKGFGAIADSLNGNVRAAIKSLESESNQGFFDNIFGNTAAAQQNLSKVFDPLIDSFLRLSSVGSDFLPRLVDGLVDLTERFDNFIVRAEADGSLDKWINQGIDEFKALGNTILNVGSMLNSLSEAFTGSGGKTFLQTLEDGTESLAEFMRSSDGQDRLQRFFVDARAELENWKPLLAQLPDLLANVAAAGQQWADMMLPFLRTIATVLADHPAIVNAVFYAYLGWKGILPIFKGLSSGVGMLNAGVDLFRVNTDKTGKQMERGITQKVKNLTSALISPGGLAAGAITVIGVVGTDLAAAHADAEEAARRQREEVDKLTGSLDAMTGAATGATRAQVGKNLTDAMNERTGQKFPDLGGLLSDPKQYVDAVVSGNLDAALAMIPQKATAADVTNYEAGSWWRDNQESLQKAGLTPEVIANAINGEPNAIKKFTDWQYNEMSRKAPPGTLFEDPATLDWMENRGLISKTVDLNDLHNSLPEQAKMGAALSGETYAYNNTITQGGQDIRTQNQYAFGRFQLKPGSALGQFGPVGDPSTDDGKTFGMVTGTSPQPNTALYDQLRNDGVTFEPDGNGRFIVRMGAEAANKYLQRMATGGMITGPGSGTSDSILAALSNGEYVVNAAATRQHLPLLESINGGGPLPAFAPGGPVEPNPTPPVPSLLDPNWRKTIPINSSGAMMDAANRPGEFDRGEFQSAGQAQAARRGIDTSARKEAYSATAKPSFIGNAFSAVGKGLGVVPGYDQTRTATLGTENSAWSALNAPAPAKPPVDKSKFADPNVPKSARDFLGQAWGVPIQGSGDNRKPVFSVPDSSASKPSVKGSVGASTDSRVNPNTAVHSGAGQPGPYGQKSTTGFSTGWGFPTRPISVSPSSAGFIPGGALLPQGLAAGSEAGLRSSTIRGRRALQAAFPFLEEVGGYREDPLKWHPNGQALDAMIPSSIRFTEQGYALGDNITQWALQNSSDLGVEHVIWNKKIYYPNGRVENMRVTGDRTQDHEDHPHIVFGESPYPTANSQYFAPAGGIAPFGIDQQGFPVATSPSNIPMATTPTGVGLPQVTYGPTAGGGSVSIPGAAGSAGGGGIRMPTPEEYAKYVSESWMNTLQNMVQNAGQIALGFLGSFFGLDLSKITGTANSVMSGIDLPGMNDSGDEDAASQLDALPEVDSIMQQLNQLPPEYQQAYEQAVAENPGQAGLLLQQLMAMAQGGGTGSVQFDPSKGAEQWRPVVRKILEEVGPRYGITNFKAWEDDIIGQINLESKGNPGAHNPNDTDGKGGTQQVFGLGQFLPSTFAAHNRSGGDISDPVAQIYAMIDYLASPKYGVIPDGGVNWKGVGWRNGKGYAMGGKIKGSGGPRSDSIIARVSNGEYIVRAPMAQKHMGLLEAINANTLPGFADGGIVNPLFPTAPLPPVPPPPSTPAPPPAPMPPPPNGPVADAAAGMPTAPTPVTNNMGPGDAESTALKDVGATLGGIGEAVSGVADGASAPAGGNPEGDPRAVLGGAPQNLDHNKPAVSQGIQAAGSAISGAISTAMSVAAAGAGAASPAAGAGAASASGIIQGLIGAGSTAVSGAVNILSSLGVGTVTPSTSTAGAYGAPLTPQAMGQQPYQGPSVVNNWNGGVHTSNNEEFYKLQQRRELQNAAPFLPQR